MNKYPVVDTGFTLTRSQSQTSKENHRTTGSRIVRRSPWHRSSIFAIILRRHNDESVIVFSCCRSTDVVNQSTSQYFLITTLWSSSNDISQSVRLILHCAQWTVNHDTILRDKPTSSVFHVCHRLQFNPGHFSWCGTSASGSYTCVVTLILHENPIKCGEMALSHSPNVKHSVNITGVEEHGFYWWTRIVPTVRDAIWNRGVDCP